MNEDILVNEGNALNNDQHLGQNREQTRNKGTRNTENLKICVKRAQRSYTDSVLLCLHQVSSF